MRVHKTKYANLTTDELLKFADKHSDSLTDIGRELMYRMEIVYRDAGDSRRSKIDQALKTA
jgi:hypothetical protein